MKNLRKKGSQTNSMKSSSTVSFVILMLMGVTILCSGCAQKTQLFNGRDLTGWELVVDSNDVEATEIWSVKDDVIHCEGKPNSYIRTVEKYSNYKLHLEWRWVEEPTNSGVLLHASGEEKIWPRSIEAQLKAENAGDLVLIGHTGITVGSTEHHDPNEMYVTVVKKYDSNEKKPGKWNSYDIYCQGDSILVCVNGRLQNLARKATDTEGWICLQSEGSPIEFRNISIKHLKVKPETKIEVSEDKERQEEKTETEPESSEDKGSKDEKTESQSTQ